MASYKTRTKKSFLKSNSFLYISGVVASFAILCAILSAFNVFNVRSSVLGWWGTSRVDTLYLPQGNRNFTGGSVISMNSTEEPAITIADSPDYSSKSPSPAPTSVTIDVYETDANFLLKYLTHDKDSNQVNKTFDVSQLNRTANFTHDLTKGSRVVLPLGEKGIFFIRATAGSIFHDAMIVRSNFGVTVKDGKNEFIFWGQNYKTKRSISSGTVKIYNLKEQVTVTSSGTFDSSGIAKADIVPDADVALAEVDGEYALIPINMQYLNLNYNYISYSKSTNNTKYFVFTDRPLYRPGDSVNFKAILREDDDAIYSIPTGTARVRIYRGYDENNTIYDKNFPIDNGAVFGEIKLPADARTGDYLMKVSFNNQDDDFYQNTTAFQIEYFKKPEYFLDIEAPQSQLIQGDSLSFTVKGSFFSGQPLNKEKISYQINTSDYWDYSYYTDQSIFLNDDYRYGYFSGKKLMNEEVLLDDRGEAKVTLSTKGKNNPSKSNIYSIEASLTNKSLAPAFARKNVLVYAGEFGIYRTEYQWSSEVNKPVAMPLMLAKRISNASVGNKTLKATVKRDAWIPYQEPNKKYLSYRHETEDLPAIQATTSPDGKAQLNFIPTKPGSYTFVVTTQDSRGNQISNTFYQYITKEGEPTYRGDYGSSAPKLSLSQDKEQYRPSDALRLTINSEVPDRDVLLTFQRNYVHRYQVVRVDGKSKVVDIPLQNDDLPNFYLQAMSFDQHELDRDNINIKMDTIIKKINVKVTPERGTYGPGDTATVMVETTDYTGSPIPAETALWSVDKAIFELTENNLGDIHSQFWAERYDGTRLNHSLEGIESEPFGGGGGCFVAGTKILMGDGSTKNIEDVKVGDVILTKAGRGDSQLVKARVADVHQARESDLIILNGSLQLTGNHILSVNNTWKPAQEVTIGDELILSNGKKQTVTSIEYQRGEQDVYNLEIEKYHTFFANNFWVHNQKGGEPLARGVFKDVAYWNPRVYTDSTGRAKVSFKIPDNLTTWVVAAVSNTSDTKVGQTTAEIKVSKDIVMRPILPNVFKAGDEIIVGAFVENFTDNQQTVDLDLAFDSGTVQQSAFSAQVIPAHDRKEFTWKLKPEKENKKAKLTFSAKNTQDKKLSDTIISEIPVYSFGFMEKTSQVADGATTFNTNLAPDLNKEKSALTLSIAPSLLQTLPTSAKYLIEYPYGCVEQTTSRFAPAVIAKSNPELFAEAMQGKDVNDMIQKGVARLEQLQLPSGGWSWWFDAKPDYFVTGYVVEYLMQAQKLGITVPPEMLSSAKYFLERDDVSYYDPNLGKYQDVTPTLETTILKTYALTMIQSPKAKKEITMFAGLTPDLVAIATLTNALNGYTEPNKHGLTHLISMAKPQGDALYWEGGNEVHFGSKNATTALAIRAILTAKGDSTTATKAIRYLTRSRESYYWSNTFATAQVLRTISEFSQYENAGSPNYSYTVLADGKEISKGQVTRANQKIKDITIPLTGNPPKITVQKQGEGALYSTLLAEQYHTDKKSAAVQHPLRVTRQYYNDTNPGYSFKPGDVAIISLSVSGLTADDNYAVIQDELPSGMVPINERFKNEQSSNDYSGYYYYPFYNTDREYTENGVILTAYHVYSGTNTYSYKARVVSEGTFAVPPATASLMYAPEVSGRSGAEVVKISKDVQKVSETPIWQDIGNHIAKSNLSPQVKTAIAFGGSIAIAALLGLAIKLNWNTTKAIFNSIKKRIKPQPKQE